MLGTGRFFFDAGDGFLVAEYALMGTAGVGQEDGDNEGAGSGFWMLVRGVDWVHWIDWPYRFFNPKSAFRNQKSKSWILYAGCCLLVFCHWSLAAGYSCLVNGIRRKTQPG